MVYFIRSYYIKLVLQEYGTYIGQEIPYEEEHTLLFPYQPLGREENDQEKMGNKSIWEDTFHSAWNDNNMNNSNKNNNCN